MLSPALIAGAISVCSLWVATGRGADVVFDATGIAFCSKASRSAGSLGRLSEKTHMPPDNATTEVQTRASSSVSGGRTTRQSGSLSQTERW